MRINEVKDFLKAVWNSGETIVLVGHAGVGKTTIVKQVAQELGYKVHVVILSQLEPGDLMGVPVQVNGKTVFSRPEWLPDEPKSVLFLDELNRAPLYVKQAILQLVLEKQIGPHKLPEDCVIIAAMNPFTDEYLVGNMDDKAMLDRFIWIKVQNSMVELADYFRGKGYEDNKVMAALLTLDQLKVFNEDFSLPRLSPTPRSMERLLKISNLIGHLPIEQQMEVYSGIVGPEAAAEFYRRWSGTFIRVEDFLNGNVEKIKKAHMIEKVLVILKILEKPELVEKVKIWDIIKNEEWAAVFRHINLDKERYALGFIKLKKEFPQVKDIYKD
ncbi:MAG: MoxR family ATPase [Fervidobacterium sp.]|nr:MoxR family ATPase [Fervidobacterium sp.]